MVKQAPRLGARRAYQLRIADDVYVRYQQLAKDLGITMSRLLNEAIAYGLGDGLETPSWWGSPEHRQVSPEIAEDSGPTLRAPAGMPVRVYSIQLPVKTHAAYQRLALDLNVTMSRLFREVLQFGLGDGEQVPTWWSLWQERAAQESLLLGKR